MSATQKPSHRVDVPEALLAAVTRNAEADAERAAAFLRSIGYGSGSPDSRTPIHPVAALELGAVLRIRHWETVGIRRYLPADLPESRSAMSALGKRLTEAATKADGVLVGTPLAEMVFAVWFRHFAWDGPAVLQAELVVSAPPLPDEDEFVEHLARLLWNNRAADRRTTPAEPRRPRKLK